MLKLSNASIHHNTYLFEVSQSFAEKR